MLYNNGVNNYLTICIPAAIGGHIFYAFYIKSGSFNTIYVHRDFVLCNLLAVQICIEENDHAKRLSAL